MTAPRNRAPGRALIACVIALVAWASGLAFHTAAGRAAPAPLTVAMTDGLFRTDDDTTRELWLGRARQASIGMIRAGASWSGIAPGTRPVGFRATDPDDPAYRWEALDRVVRSVAEQGMELYLTVSSAPTWATTAAGRPATIRANAWRPNAAEFRRFAIAIGRRYNGQHPDPLHPGRVLPMVRYFEVWNEPNLDIYLAPQWEGRRATGAILYRGLLNAFYAGVKRANPRAKVIAGATAPYGDEPGGDRIRPVVFLKRLLCMRAPGKPVKPCRQRPRFDIYSHHSINVGVPTRSALDLRDASTPDLSRIVRVLRRAYRQRLAAPRGHKPIWNTEMWWDSSPPDPEGVPLRRHARWLQQALWLTWRAGGRVATYFQLRDGAPIPDFASSLQSGLYFLDGRPKPAARGMRFPFVLHRRRDGRLGVWGIAPRGGPVRIERRVAAGRWRTVRRLRTRGAPWPFTATLPFRGRTTLRAVSRGERSLAWRQH